MAACTNVVESELNPSKYYLNNVDATKNLLEVSKDKKKNFVSLQLVHFIILKILFRNR